jgi:rRNA-processing protein FCF1
MRRKKHKHLRRALRFYKINHGFRAPYKVLVDGNFVNAIVELKYVALMNQIHAIFFENRASCCMCCMETCFTQFDTVCRRGDIQSLIPQFLGEKCRIFTTRCCIDELKRLGPNLSGTLLLTFTTKVFSVSFSLNISLGGLGSFLVFLVIDTTSVGEIRSST